MSCSDLFQRILSSNNVFYKHQQVGQDDLTDDQRLKLLSELYESNKPVFIQRYEKFMHPSDCSNFEDCKDSTSAYLLCRIMERTQKQQSIPQVRNRRFLKVAHLKSHGTYFSDEKMREREPYLYDVMVGRFLSEADRIHLRPTVSREECGGGGWAGLLSQFEETEEISKRRDVHKARWHEESEMAAGNSRRDRFVAHVENTMERDSDNEDEEEDNLDDLREEIDRIGKEEAEMLEDTMDGTPEQLREEFDSFMVERFLAGKDSRFFDYDTVDKDENIDDNDVIRERDAEEKWFDED